MRSKLVECEQERMSCACITKDGYCLALEDTKFRYSDGTVKACPFYKHIKDKKEFQPLAENRY